MNTVLEDKVQWLANDLAASRAIDDGMKAAPDFLQFLMDLFKELLPIILKCFMSAAQALAAINEPNWFQEARLKGFLRRQMRDDRMERRLLAPMTKSFIKLGKTITADEYTALQNAA